MELLGQDSSPQKNKREGREKRTLPRGVQLSELDIDQIAGTGMQLP